MGLYGRGAGTRRRLCRRLSVLYELNSEICIARGDDISANAWKAISKLVLDIGSEDPSYLEHIISDKRELLLQVQEEEH